MKGTRKLFSILTALALCLSLLPGTALALDETPEGVTFANGGTEVPLTDGKFYVAATDNKGITEAETEPESGPYLKYNGTDGTLTVHGAFVVNATVNVNSDLTITGGADSSLAVTGANGIAFQLNNDSTLALGGSVNFTANANGSPVIFSPSSTGTFRTTETYSGDIALSCAVNIPAVSDTTLNVQSSGSIAITGMIDVSGKSVVLQSTGKVSITSNSPLGPTVTIKGANVELKNNSSNPVFNGNSGSLNITATGNVTIQNGGQDDSPTIVGTAKISAKGTVTISGGSLPIVPSGETDSLTINGAQNVSITGKSSTSYAFFYVPVTFENCTNVTVTDNGDGDILKKRRHRHQQLPLDRKEKWG